MLEVTGNLSGWQTVEMTYFMTPSLISLPPRLAASLRLFFTLLGGFLISYVFSTCMPHYILKVNPINTEITLEDKLLGGDPPPPLLITIAWRPWIHFPLTISAGYSRSYFIHFDKATFLTKYWLETKDK